MKITPEIQSIIDSEVSKIETVLEAKYREHFVGLKSEMYSTLKDYANEALSKNIKLESIDNTCETKIYKPIVEGILSLFKSNGIKVNLNESINVDSSESDLNEARMLLMEATRKIQEMRDMIKIHEIIQSSLTGLKPEIVEQALARFQNDPKYNQMAKEDILKDVAKYVISLNGTQKRTQLESEGIDTSELDSINTMLESKTESGDPFTSPFKPANTFKVSTLKRTVLDEAYGIRNTQNTKKVSDDPAQEVLDILGM